jgi:SAM-dependent methyltransferase
MQTIDTSRSYVFDQAWQRELERLRSIQSLFDPATQRHLAALGVGAGWQCLEVGCGAGSIALWLAERVGPSGSVLATDLDPRFLQDHGRANLTVIRHDLTRDALAPASFDLIHARAVLCHLRDRPAALGRLVSALRPGGWLVIEDVDFGGTAASMIARYVVPTHEALNCERMYSAVAAVFANAGADATFASQLPAMLTEVGLEDIGGELHAPLVSGGNPSGFVPLSLQHLQPHILAAGDISETELHSHSAFLADPASRYLPPIVLTAWGRQPTTA